MFQGADECDVLALKMESSETKKLPVLLVSQVYCVNVKAQFVPLLFYPPLGNTAVTLGA